LFASDAWAAVSVQRAGVGGLSLTRRICLFAMPGADLSMPMRMARVAGNDATRAGGRAGRRV